LEHGERSPKKKKPWIKGGDIKAIMGHPHVLSNARKKKGDHTSQTRR